MTTPRPQISLSPVVLRPTDTRVTHQAGPAITSDSHELSEIYPNFLFLGGDLVAKNLQLLQSHDITHVLNCAHKVCPAYYPHSLTYVCLDLLDSPKETLSHFILHAIFVMEECRLRKSKILVHCHQGISRSASLVIAYVAWRENWAMARALEYVKSKRSIVHPNQGFVNQLMDFERMELNSVALGPSLHVVARHKEDGEALIVKRSDHPKSVMHRPNVVFLLHEGPGGDVLIRNPPGGGVQIEMDTAIKVANWMVMYQKAYGGAKIWVVEHDDVRFEKALQAVPSIPEAREVEEIVVSN